MLILIFFAFIAGIVTILSPCILPILPVVLSGSVTTGKRKPFGIVAGFISSFTFFTLLTSALVKATGIDPDSLRAFSIGIIVLFGLSLIVPQLQTLSERLFSKLSGLSLAKNQGDGLWGGFLIGLSIGLVWTPCVGPILAAVISLSFTTTASYASVFITLAYAVGTAIPMIGIIFLGKSLFRRIPFLLSNLPRIQQGFGVLMLLTAVMLLTNTDRKLQTYLLEQFPQWGSGLTRLEDTSLVRKELDKLQNRKGTENISGLAPELVVGGEWFNSEPQTMAGLKGKVVLVDFWTYTCINCIRTIPYLRTWNEKYADKGLVIVGVHSPEFAFEKDAKNVQKAIQDFSIKYPVMQDNDFATWRAYNNRYWPAKYLVDAEGRIRYTHFGEGKYDETESKIQELLKERDKSVSLSSVDNPEYALDSRTPELYMGYGRLEALDSKERVDANKEVRYTPTSKTPPLNKFDWNGKVTISKEHALPAKGAVLRLSYDAKNVFLVMRSNKGESRVRVLLDGKQVDEVMVTTDRLYTLVESEKAEQHILTLEFLDDGTELFAFTFG